MKKIVIKQSTGSKFLEHWRIRTVLPFLKGCVLDIGCGHNNLTANYKKLFQGNGVGVDIVDWNGVDTVVENSAKMPTFQDASFNTVTFLACINHIVNREDVLKEARRVLSPDGILIITMIPRKLGDWWHRFTENFYGKEKHSLDENSGEVGGMDKNEVRELIVRAKFVMREEIPFMFGLNRMYIAEKHEHCRDTE